MFCSFGRMGCSRCIKGSKGKQAGSVKTVLAAIAMLLSTTLLWAAKQEQGPNFIAWKYNKACVHWVDSVYNRLSVEERIGQFFMIPAYAEGAPFNMDSVVSKVRRSSAGGVIFFRTNPLTLATWANRIQDSSKVGTMVAIDGEWGLSMRLDSTIAFPHQIALGAIADNKLIYEMGREIGRQCKRAGIQINFAPDVDVNNNANNPVINDRSFGENKFKVALKGVEYANGLQDEGILTSAKHFPGHGDTDKDSHVELPQVNKSYGALDSLELFPFKILINSGVGGVMVAHLNVPALDSTPNSTASLSHRITTNLLKDSLHFDGLVFSDAINMQGVAKYYKAGTVDSIAFMAGCDILVCSEAPDKGIAKIKMALDSGVISQTEMEARVKKVLAYKYLLGLNNPPHVNTNNLLEDLNNPYAKALRQKLYEQAITIAANQNNFLPLRGPMLKKVASLSVGNNGSSAYQRYINQFAEMDFWNQSLEHSDRSFANIIDTLGKYDLVIVDLHAMSRLASKQYNVTEEFRHFIEALSGRTRVVLTVFGNPYSLKYFEFLPWVICGYEDNDASNLAAANALFGAEKIGGRLPVTSCKTFQAGFGFFSDTIYRLKLSNPEEAGLAPAKFQRLDEVIQKAISAKAFPGCQLLVAQNGKVILNKAYGNKLYELADPVKQGDIYDLASITKVAATTMAVMKLYEQKKINLDKTVGDYVKLPDDATIKHLKLKDVLTHQAGLVPFLPFWKATVGKNLEQYYRTTPNDTFNVQVADSMFIRYDYPDTMWSMMAHSKVDPHPSYVYSDLDFYTLQKVVEAVSGKKLDDYVRENFYEPMGLTRIGFHPLNRFTRDRMPPTENDSFFRKQIVRGYVHDPGSAMYGGVAGHAGLFSNAYDLAALFQMVLNKGNYNGKRILDSATVKIFTARQSKISRRGYGFDKPEPDINKASPCYDGVSLETFGHTGFTGTCVWSDPKYNLTYIFLSNRVYPNAENNLLVKMNVRTELQEAIYKALDLH